MKSPSLRFLIILMAFRSSLVWAEQVLPSFHVDETQTSVSGISSGGFMAVQFHTAYSAKIMGAGIVAGGPFDCAFANIPGPVDPVSEWSPTYAGVATCMHAIPTAPDGMQSFEKAKQFAAIDRIDSVDHLVRSRIYIFGGTVDRTVVPGVVAATYAYYRAAGVPKERIEYVHDVPAGHAFVSPAGKGSCEKTETPYINHCTVNGQAYDQAGAILTQIYGHLNAPSTRQTGRLVTFDQAPFDGGALGPQGFLYVPHSCDEGAVCRIHIAFHGCKQTSVDIGDRYYNGVGYNRWADTNNILALYPQAPSDHPLNPEHCWDWWGYTGPDFDAKAGPQMSAIKKMLDAIAR